jgi:hypothetical protein
MNIELKLFEATDFMGIDTSKPIIIDFSKVRKSHSVVMFKGDQGVNKTSTMTALMYLMGAAFEIDMKSFVNLKDETLDARLEFEYDGERYKVEAKPNRLVLKKQLNGLGKFMAVDEPKATLRKIFGNLGVSPLFLKEMPGKKQIQWFKDTFGADEEASKKEKKLISQYETLFSQRRDINRDIKTVRGALEADPLYQNYEKSQEKFKSPPNAKKEKEEFDTLMEKNQEFSRAKDGVVRLQTDLELKKQEIESLRQKLADAIKKEEEIQKRIDNGEKWLEENKDIPARYEAANEAWLNLSKSLTEYERWKTVLKREKELNEMEQTSMEATGTLDKLRLDLLKITRTYLPGIEGLEMKLKMGLDDEEEGIYYNGKSLAQLSESELWDLFENIWAEKGVQFVFCENITSLGSEAVKTLNRLVKEKKAQVFATAMDRSKKDMEIIFSTKIDL